MTRQRNKVVKIVLTVLEKVFLWPFLKSFGLSNWEKIIEYVGICSRWV